MASLSAGVTVDVRGATSLGYKTAQEIKGQADAKATAIYARAHGRDPELYQFLKTLETLTGGLDEKTWLILSTGSDLLKYLEGDRRTR